MARVPVPVGGGWRRPIKYAGRGRGRPDSATAAEAHIPKKRAPSRGGLGDLLRILGILGPVGRERWALEKRQRHNTCSLERACELQTLWCCAGRWRGTSNRGPS